MRRLVIIAVIMLSLPFAAANAAVGDWFVSDGAKLRLISLRDGATGKLSAALHIVLEPGWKTYWRSPGSSGIPPQLDFSQSKNISFSGVKFPTPIAFKDGGALTSGYKNEVVLPLDVDVIFPEQDVILNAQGLIGVCGEICIPLQFSAQLTDKANGGSSFEAAQLLSNAKANMPEEAGSASKLLSIDPKEGLLLVEASVPNGASKVTLFVEGPHNWYLSPAEATKIENGKAWFSVGLPDTVKPADASGTNLRATLVIDGKGYEQDLAVR